MNYPSGIMKKTTRISHANRGMGLESDINITNKYYLDNNIAVVHKRPTSITIKKVEYPNNKYTKITDGYFKAASTTDYNGLYKGYYIDFEAKETTSKTSFPLSNIHSHQLKHISNIINHGGIAFLIVRFSKLNKTYAINGNFVLEKIKIKKSIPISDFETFGELLKEAYQPRLDYIKVIEKYIKELQYEKHN